MKLGIIFAAISVSLGCGQPGLGGDDSTGQDSGTTDTDATTSDGAVPPADSGGGGQDSGTCTDNGPVTGTVGANGGTLSRLLFAVVGDTRPQNEDDPNGYPTAIITKIFQGIQGQNPRPPFALGTGDYQFSSTGSNATATQQVGIYMQTRQSYSGAFFPAMGNHECGVSGGFTTSDNNNCGPGNQGGSTPNYKAFMSQMLGPISKTNPYYSFNVNAADNSWTAKFVITAANAWDTAQQTWLKTTMAQATTYTFVVRHEASDATPPLPPGVAGVDAVIASYPYTMLIVGHAHTYYWYYKTPNVVTFGNGGAPLSSKDYGYGLFSQRCDGAIVGRRDQLSDRRGRQQLPLRRDADGTRDEVAQSSTNPSASAVAPARADAHAVFGRVAAAERHADVLAAFAAHAERLERDRELERPLLVEIVRRVDGAVDLVRGVDAADRASDRGPRRDVDRALGGAVEEDDVDGVARIGCPRPTRAPRCRGSRRPRRASRGCGGAPACRRRGGTRRCAPGREGAPSRDRPCRRRA